MKQKIDIIQFDKESLPMILEIYNKELDERGRIIDKNVKEVEVDPYSNKEVTKDNFAGVLVGSKVFVTKNTASFAEHISKYCKNG